jgi:hypothetical protein
MSASAPRNKNYNLFETWATERKAEISELRMFIILLVISHVESK